MRNGGDTTGPDFDGAPTEDPRTGLRAPTLRRAIMDHLTYEQGVLPALATTNDWYLALAHTVRDHLLRRWVRTVPRRAAAS